MKITLQPHLKLRLKQRSIPKDYLNQILKLPEEKYLDTITGHSIAIKSLLYNGKVRPMVVAYDKVHAIIQIITIYPTTKQEIQDRIKAKRWIKNETN